MVNVMVTYLQSGQGKQKSTKWLGGSGACKTSFKTHMTITSSSGSKRKMKKEKGEYIWGDVRPGDKIRYNVFTGADDKKGDSDEYYLIASTMNWPYIINIYNEINRSATQEQMDSWESNPQGFEELILSKIDESKLMLTITSKVNKTGNEGKESKLLNIPNTWPSGPIQLAFVYGYDNDARAGDASRVWSNVFDVATYVSLAVTAIGLLVLCPISAGATCAVGGAIGASIIAIDVAEVAYLVYEQYTQGLATQIGRNKYGCSFPEGAYVHIYSIVINNPNKDPFLQIDSTAAIKNPVTTSGNSFSLMNKNTLFIVGCSIGLFMTIWSVLGGEVDE
jgi:hypothetical protein